MEYLGPIIGLSWIAFLVVWFVSAFGAKRNLHTVWWRNSWLRIIIALVVYFIFKKELEALILTTSTAFSNPILTLLGTALTVIGIAIAIWARVYIGRNWGMPMSLKEDRELVTSGPYRYVRHPIYSGLMLAMIGSAIAIEPLLLVIFVIYFLYFLFSATSEEKTLEQEFPDAYPAYKKRTKMLIPFVL